MPPRNTLLLHVCYRVKFCRPTSNRLGAGRVSIFFRGGEGGHWDPAPRDGDMADPLETCFSPPMLPCQIRSFYVIPFQRIITEICQKISTLSILVKLRCLHVFIARHHAMHTGRDIVLLKQYPLCMHCLMTREKTCLFHPQGPTS